MSLPSARRVLVLGGTRSGKSSVAESLVGEASSLRRVIAAQQVGDDLRRLPELIAKAWPDETLLVDDLGSWLAEALRSAGADSAAGPDDPVAGLTEISSLVEAVRGCRAARLVLVSPEVGLSVVPAGLADRRFAEAHGVLNRSVAAECDAVALIVAGRPVWLPAGLDAAQQPAAPAQTPTPTGAAAQPAPAPGAQPAPAPVAGAPAASLPDFTVATPDAAVATAALDRLKHLDLPGAGLGALTAVVRFAAATQVREQPQPWRQVRVLLLHGEYSGGIGAAVPAGEAQRRYTDAHRGIGPIPQLASAAEASVVGVECPPTDPIEERDALIESTVDAALRQGWDLANGAVDEGVDLLVLAAGGTGGIGAAAAVTALISGNEPAALLPTAALADGQVDDLSWMRSCGAIREALHRVRLRMRDPRTVLAMLGGGEIAVATGVLLGAAARRTPVLIDGPVGAAAALVARDRATESAKWLLLPDHGEQPTIKLAASMLTLDPLFDLRLGLGEGATSLMALPTLRAALMLSAGTPTRAARPAVPADVVEGREGTETGGGDSTGADEAPSTDPAETHDAPGDDPAEADAPGTDPAAAHDAPGDDPGEPPGSGTH